MYCAMSLINLSKSINMQLRSTLIATAPPKNHPPPIYPCNCSMIGNNYLPHDFLKLPKKIPTKTSRQSSSQSYHLMAGNANITGTVLIAKQEAKWWKRFSMQTHRRFHCPWTDFTLFHGFACLLEIALANWLRFYCVYFNYFYCYRWAASRIAATLFMGMGMHVPSTISTPCVFASHFFQ